SSTSTTTTTTLPGGGCAGLAAPDGLRCLCAVGINSASCVGEPVPGAVGAAFTRACAAVEKAASTSGKRASRFYKRARRLFAGGTRSVRPGAKRKNHRWGTPCASDLPAVFASGKTLAGAALGGH